MLTRLIKNLTFISRIFSQNFGIVFLSLFLSNTFQISAQEEQEETFEPDELIETEILDIQIAYENEYNDILHPWLKILYLSISYYSSYDGNTCFIRNGCQVHFVA